MPVFMQSLQRFRITDYMHIDYLIKMNFQHCFGFVRKTLCLWKFEILTTNKNSYVNIPIQLSITLSRVGLWVTKLFRAWNYLFRPVTKITGVFSAWRSISMENGMNWKINVTLNAFTAKNKWKRKYEEGKDLWRCQWIYRCIAGLERNQKQTENG